MKMRNIYLLLIVALVLYLYYLGKQPIKQPEQTAVATATPSPAPPPPTPNPAPPPPANPQPRANADDRVQAIARQMKVRVAINHQASGVAILDVDWNSDIVTQGTEFVERLHNEGIIGGSFEVVGAPLKQSIGPDGRRLMSVRFKVGFY